MNSLKKMDRFLETYNLPRLNQEVIENTNRQITSTEIETVIKELPKIKVQDQIASQVNFIFHIFKYNIIYSTNAFYFCYVYYSVFYNFC